ncbi:hypothetical protein TNCV_869551 [Trichonephila clavipes]|nr:hypothetical protein TNCV_869551 [Trichonephila clavipes]
MDLSLENAEVYSLKKLKRYPELRPKPTNRIINSISICQVKLHCGFLEKTTEWVLCYRSPFSGTEVTHAWVTEAWEPRFIDASDTVVATSLATVDEFGDLEPWSSDAADP